jgi:hypothetical protein
MGKRRDNSFLKRCKDCNRKPVKRETTIERVRFVCPVCLRSTNYWFSKEQARRAWNDLNKKGVQ